MSRDKFAITKKEAKDQNIELPENFELSKEFEKAFNLIEDTNNNVYVTGDAGTGKSTFLKYFRKNTKKKIIVLAPTGVAALNVSGQTIHSFFELPHTFIQKSDIVSLDHKKNLIQEIDTIVIDEVSMVRADLIDAVDLTMRLTRNAADIPFGGAQVILIGDLCQLPPVVEKSLREPMRKVYKSQYFFDAYVFNEAKIFYVELTKQFRQVDNELTNLLNKIRTKTITDADLALLNKRVCEKNLDGNPVILTLTNDVADSINCDKLEELKTKEYCFEADIEGNFYGERSYPADIYLVLKKGAQVMMLHNDPKHRWVNGTMAIIEDLTDDSVKVLINNNIYDVKRHQWTRIGYEYNYDENRIEQKIVGTFEQYPMRLAWAITVHKSQGKTFDLILIVTGRPAFAHGQIYVGLSRCRTFDGIYLLYPIGHNDIIYDTQIEGYKTKFKKFEF